MNQMDDPATLALTSAFLQEAVFASRGASHGFSPRSLDGASGCGLGLRPTLPDDFSPKQAELLTRLGESLGPAAALPFDVLREHAAAWVRAQDALDRQRNHFLKDFRNALGFDRTSWSAEVQSAFRTGLDEINADNRARLEAAAAELRTCLRSV